MAMRHGREWVSEAVVLKSRTIGENDLWVDFLTRDQGRLHGIARHGRKSHRRFGTVLESLNVVRLRYRQTGDLASLEEAVLLPPVSHLENDLERLVSGFYLADLVRELIPERSPDPKVYALLRESLESLDRDRARSATDVVLHFQYRLLELCGYSPQLKQCLSCARPRTKAGRFHFVYRDGGILCADCLVGGIPADELTLKALPAILAKFIEYQLGHPLKSRKLLTEVAFYG